MQKHASQVEEYKRRWTRYTDWTQMYPGMWAWVLQRLAAILLLVLLPWHWLHPYSQGVRITLLAVVIFHGMNGIKTMLNDLGWGITLHRPLLLILLVLGVLIFFYFAW